MATFPPYWAGIGNVAYHNARTLAERGLRVDVMTAAYPLDGYVDPPGVNVHRLPAALRFGNAPFTPALLRHLQRYDLVHLHWPYIFGAELTWLACKLASVPYVVTYHMDLRADLRWQFGPYQRLVGPLVLRQASRVFPVSIDYLRASPVCAHLTGRWERVVEVPNGVDVAQFRAGDAASLRADLGIPRNAFVVGYVGAMDRPHASRGISVLLEGIARMGNNDVHLLAVGQGELREEYQRHAERLGIRERTHWPGAVPAVGDMLPHHYAAMDVVVLPSLRAESFGMILIEGMAAGKPVVGTTLPGVRQVVDEGRDGLLVPPGDAGALAGALKLLVDDPDLRARMGRAGRGKVESRYDWRVIAAVLERQYLAVVERRPPRHRLPIVAPR